MSKRKYKLSISRQKIIFGILVSISYLIMVTNYKNADYEGYYIMFNNSIHNQYWMEYGYWAFEKIFYNLGFDFFWFRLIYLSIAFVLLLYTIFYYSKVPQTILGLYMLYPFLFDVVQIRNFMAASIILFSLKYIEGRNKNDTIKFILLYILAISQHKSAFVYGGFIFLRFVSVNNVKKIVKYILPVYVAFISFFGMMFPKLGNIFGEILGKSFRADWNLVKSALLWTLLGAIVCFWGINNYKEESDYKEIYKVAYSALLFIPLITFDYDIYRIYRNLIIIYHIILCTPENRGKIKINTIMSIVYAGILFFMQLSKRNWGNYITVTEMIINNNYFLDFLGL